MHNLPLEIVGEDAARPGSEEVNDLSIGRPLARLHEGVEDAPQNAWLLRCGFVLRGSLVAEKRTEIAGLRRVTHC